MYGFVNACVLCGVVSPAPPRALADAHVENRSLQEEVLHLRQESALRGAQLRVLALGGALPPQCSLVRCYGLPRAWVWVCGKAFVCAAGFSWM